jgi:hypothetical protein
LAGGWLLLACTGLDGAPHGLVDPQPAITNCCTPQFDKVTADAAEFKAGFDKALLDNVEQKAQVRVGGMLQ